MQSLQAAIRIGYAGHDRGLAIATTLLHGCPVGGWGETTRAFRQISDALPATWKRDYTIHDWVDAVYSIDDAQRYRRRTLEQALTMAETI